MATQKIERVDDIPLILHWLKNMHIAEVIDGIWKTHGNRQGLTYGQLAVLFITYLVHSLNHRLSNMEEWAVRHRIILEEVTGWKIGEKDATDDRLGDMLEVLGGDQEKICEFESDLGKHLIQAYELPTEVARYDTTSFNVHHNSDKNNGSLLKLGHSKDKRPDLLQFKQGLGVLDPAGVPVFSDTFAGNDADDPKYVPAWRSMAEIIWHTNFLYVADSKASALETRAIIDKEGGKYIFQLPMTGNVPEDLKKYVAAYSATAEEIYLEEDGECVYSEKNSDSGCNKTSSSEQTRKVGYGFVVKEEMEWGNNEKKHIWNERRLVIQSEAHAERQKKSLKSRLEKAEKALGKLTPKKEEKSAQFQARVHKILGKYSVKDCFEIQVIEELTKKKQYTKKGRPGPDTPYTIEEICRLKLSFNRVESVINDKYALAGWRIYVTNTEEQEMTIQKSVRYYRDEWRVERGMHRLKRGSIQALPLFLRLDERIKGLILLLTIALRVITLLEFVIRRELKKNNETLAGLVPGNPKMKTARPTTERILAQFKEINCLIEQDDGRISGKMVEQLNPLQERILLLPGVPPEIYKLSFEREIAGK